MEDILPSVYAPAKEGEIQLYIWEGDVGIISTDISTCLSYTLHSVARYACTSNERVIAFYTCVGYL